MHRHIDTFQQKLTSYFNQMVLGSAFVQLGRFVQNPDDINIKVTLTEKTTSEPTPLSDLIYHAPEVGAGITELFSIRAIAAWNDLLTDIFNSFLVAHLTTDTKHTKLAQRKATINFSSSAPIIDQIQQSVGRDFDFQPYKARIKTIEDLCNTNANFTDDLTLIKKHVFIRNNSQHHSGLVTEELLRDLGTSKLKALDENGQPIYFGNGERIVLLIPELNLLKAALYRITIHWRETNADIPA